MATESSRENSVARTVTRLPGLKANPEMSAFGYLIGGGILVGLLPILPIVAVVWVVWRLLGSPSRPEGTEA